LVPALHAWGKKSLKKNLKWLQKYGDSDYVAVGSIVNPEFQNYTGFFGDRQPNKKTHRDAFINSTIYQREYRF